MAALGLTAKQIGIGATAYGDLIALNEPPMQKNILQHAVSYSTVFPTVDAGYLPSSISGSLKVATASLAAFILAVATGTAERKISWLLGTTEVYCYCYSGDASYAPFATGGVAAGYYRIDFTFQLSRSTVFKASDDSLLYGG